MSQVIAIFGAGSGLGTALGRRFGREGFRVALVARRADKLDALVEELATDGIEAVAFPADLFDPANGLAVVKAIRERFGRIDFVSYQPLPGGTTFIPATQLDSATLTPLVNLLLLTPVEIASAVIPEMVDRGSGGFIVTGGFTAADPGRSSAASDRPWPPSATTSTHSTARSPTQVSTPVSPPWPP